MNKIIVIGSSNTDMVIQSERIPRPGETVMGGTFYMSQGGKGANQAVCASMLGGNVIFVSKVGNDMFGQKSLESYKSVGLNTDYVSICESSASGVALIMVDSNAENCISVANGANNDLKPSDIDEVLNIIEEGDIVLLQLEIPIETVEYAITKSFDRKARIVLNPAPVADIQKDVLEKVYLITPNEIEASMLTNIQIKDEEDCIISINELHNFGIPIVVMTLGSQGCVVSTSNKKTKIPARKVNAIDTVCAGDVFNGAICVALSEGKTLDEAVVFATKASSISVTRKGAQTSIPLRTEVDSLI